MDSDRFDALARSLSIPGTRRAAMATTLGGLTSLLGLAGVDGKKKKKKKKKKKPDCTGDLEGQPCGERCCDLLSQKCCDGACIPSLSCCLPEGPVPNGESYEQCGRCQNGMLQKDPAACNKLDPDGCTICSGYQCIPGNDELPCSGGGGVCGVCSGGLCEGPGGGPPEPICGQGCCPEGSPCCRGTRMHLCCPTIGCCPDGSCAPPGFCPAG